MKNCKNVLKKILILLLLFCVNINTVIFSAVVSDNDGSAFVNKAEFEALKHDFSNQITKYEKSISNKIDGAIASYLSGINVSRPETKEFFDGEGQKVLIFDSGKINNLKRGRVAIEFSSFTLFNRLKNDQYSGLTSCSRIYMNRDASKSSAFEVFAVNKESDSDKKFQFWNDNYKFKISAIHNGDWINDYSPYSSPDTFYMRWHGAGNWPSSGYRCILPDSNERYYHCDNAYYSRYLSSNGFWQMSCAGIVHELCWSKGGDSYHLVYTPNTEMISNDNKVEYVMDRSYNTSGTTIWDHFDGNHPETQWVYADTTYTNSPYATTGTWSYSTPGADGTDITTTGFMNYTSYDTTATTYIKVRPGQLNGVTWSTKGIYNSTTSPTNTSLSWIEPLILTDKINPKSIVHSAVPKKILDEYSSFGWTGKLTEGLPIAIIDNPGTVKFKIDTTSLEENVVFAIATSPSYFQNLSSTQLLKNAPLPTGVTKFSIDGVSVTTGAKEISPDSHEIEFYVDGDSTIKIPLFFKIEYPDTNTTSIRHTIELPKTFTFTPT